MRTCEAPLAQINGTIGIDISAEQVCSLCQRMQLGPASYVAETQSVRVTVPPTRSDILHPVDIIEDVAIAYGYNNIKLVIPSTLTVGAPLPINQFTDLLRAEIARAGYVEMLTHGLCSTAGERPSSSLFVSSISSFPPSLLALKPRRPAPQRTSRTCAGRWGPRLVCPTRPTSSTRCAPPAPRHLSVRSLRPAFFVVFSDGLRT